MSTVSTNLQFSGRPHPSATIGGSEYRGTTTTPTIGASAEGNSTEIERGNKLGTIQELEIG